MERRGSRCAYQGQPHRPRQWSGSGSRHRPRRSGRIPARPARARYTVKARVVLPRAPTTRAQGLCRGAAVRFVDLPAGDTRGVMSGRRGPRGGMLPLAIGYALLAIGLAAVLELLL